MLFFFLAILSLAGLVAGLIRPRVVRVPSRSRAGLVFGVPALIFILLVGATAPVVPTPQKDVVEPAPAVEVKSATSASVLPIVAPTSAPAQTIAREGIQRVTGEAPAPSATPVVLSTATPSLIVEPAAGIGPVLAMIQKATKSVDLVMYQLEDPQVEQALAADQARGVAVRVLLNQGYYGKPETANAAAYQYLQNNKVPVRWTPAYFALTHQKTLAVDGNAALIMTFNFTPQYYATGREFGVVDTDPSDVSAIESTFAADWSASKITPPKGTNLVWSPGSQAEMVSLIGGAKSSLLVYNEEMNDAAVTTALAGAAQRGVNVEVVMTYSGSWATAFQKLAAAGVHVRIYAPSAPLYIHAKMILADGATAFVGSENFSPTSLEKNRELGIMLSAPAVVQPLSATFQDDWAGATPFAGGSGPSGTATKLSPSAGAATSSGAYYTSSYYTSKYYYPAACSGWQGLSAKYLRSFAALSDLLSAFPGRTLSPGCE